MSTTGILKQINNGSKADFPVFTTFTISNFRIYLVHFLLSRYKTAFYHNHTLISLIYFMHSFSSLLTEEFLLLLIILYRNNHIKNQVVSLLTSEVATITPREAILNIVPEAQRDLFISKVANEYEGSFVKNISLLSHQINTRTVKLGQGLKLSGPTNLFNNETIKIETDENDPSIKIIKIRTNRHDE